MPILDAYANLGKLRKLIMLKAAILDSINAYENISSKNCRVQDAENSSASRGVVDANKFLKDFDMDDSHSNRTNCADDQL